MANCTAIDSLLSMSSLPTFTLPTYSLATSSMTGPNILQGVHHSAQKSTSTGWPDLRTSLSKLDAVNSRVFAPAMISSSTLCPAAAGSFNASDFRDAAQEGQTAQPRLAG